MKNYTIREISEMFELPSSTLRYYESEELLPEVPKSSSGQRIYNDEHVERLKCINCFKRTGMTIPQLQKDSAHVHHKVEYYSEIKHALENNLPLPVWVDEE